MDNSLHPIISKLYRGGMDNTLYPIFSKLYRGGMDNSLHPIFHKLYRGGMDNSLATSNFLKIACVYTERIMVVHTVCTPKGLWWCTQSAHQRDYGGAHSLHTKGIMVVHTVCTPKGLWWCTQSAHQRDYGGAHSLHTKGIMVVHTVCTPKGLWWCTQSAHQRDYGGAHSLGNSFHSSLMAIYSLLLLNHHYKLTKIRIYCMHHYIQFPLPVHGAFGLQITCTTIIPLV